MKVSMFLQGGKSSCIHFFKTGANVSFSDGILNQMKYIFHYCTTTKIKHLKFK